MGLSFPFVLKFKAKPDIASPVCPVCTPFHLKQMPTGLPWLRLMPEDVGPAGRRAGRGCVGRMRGAREPADAPPGAPEFTRKGGR